MECVDRERLAQILLGYVSLRDREAADFEHHLAECGRCDRLADDVGQQDTLLEAVRTQVDLPALDRHGTALLTRVRSACLPAGMQPGFSDEAATHENDSEAYDAFLAPPEGPDEIGRLGPYRVLGVLGSGGMGIVFHAEETPLNRPVALKVMRSRLARQETARRLFLQEAQAAARLEHDNIIAIYRTDAANGIPFLAMPLLRGETLETRLHGFRESGRRMPVQEILAIAQGIAQALAAAHARGVIHRDIKPANIWLEEQPTSSAPWGYRIKLLDFGLARAAQDDPELQALTARAGTPSYIAPEQVLGHADERSDLYSAGCVLYELCTGHLPCCPVQNGPLLEALAAACPDPPHKLNPDVPAPLSDVVVKLLQRNPDERYQTAADLTNDLDAVAASLASPSHRPPRRWPWALAASAAVILAAGLGLYISELSKPAVSEPVIGEGPKTARPLAFTAGLSLQTPGSIDAPGERKWYRIETAVAGSMKIQVGGLDGPLDPFLRVFDAKLKCIDTNDNRVGTDARVDLDNVSEGATFFLEVSGARETTGHFGLLTSQQEKKTWPDDHPSTQQAARTIQFDQNGSATIKGSIEKKGDEDWFTFTVGGSGRLELDVDTPESSLDTHLELRDAAKVIAAGHGQGRERFQTPVTAGERYWLLMRAGSEKGADDIRERDQPTGRYVIRLRWVGKEKQ